MTLSHCWGTKKFLTLTTNNLENSRQRISLEDLTRVFQDAIHVTRFMGIDYIWIDSLCIIQDSPEDWAKESLLMEDVYSNSYCNIAATHASSGEDGCFDEVTNSLLLQRAWVFQERILAPRVLHFAPFMLNKALHAKSASDRRLAARITWMYLLNHYTACKLTLESDRLIAISGLAKLLQPMMGCRYLAGPWEDSLVAQLVWSNHGESLRATTYQAPSWSWASRPGKI
ncbi:HET-domain-containing protein, partial [Hyaloscypha hepaticicola]